MGKESDGSYSALENILDQKDTELLLLGLGDFLHGRDPSALLPVLLTYMALPQEKIDELVNLTGYFRGDLGKVSQVTIPLQGTLSQPIQSVLETLIKSPQFATFPLYEQDNTGFVLATTIRNNTSSLSDISQDSPFPPLVFSEFQSNLASSIEEKTANQQELILRRRKRQAPNRFPSLTIRQQGAQYLSLTLGYELAK